MGVDASVYNLHYLFHHILIFLLLPFLLLLLFLFLFPFLFLFLFLFLPLLLLLILLLLLLLFFFCFLIIYFCFRRSDNFSPAFLPEENSFPLFSLKVGKWCPGLRLDEPRRAYFPSDSLFPRGCCCCCCC